MTWKIMMNNGRQPRDVTRKNRQSQSKNVRIRIYFEDMLESKRYVSVGYGLNYLPQWFN